MRIHCPSFRGYSEQQIEDDDNGIFADLTGQTSREISIKRALQKTFEMVVFSLRYAVLLLENLRMFAFCGL